MSALMLPHGASRWPKTALSSLRRPIPCRCRPGLPTAPSRLAAARNGSSAGLPPRRRAVQRKPVYLFCNNTARLWPRRIPGLLTNPRESPVRGLSFHSQACRNTICGPDGRAIPGAGLGQVV